MRICFKFTRTEKFFANFCKFSYLIYFLLGGGGLVLLAYLKFFRLFCVKKLENLEIHLKGLLWVSTKWL